MLDLFNGTYNNKKVLLTGDTGFKGSWLCIWLKELGADVYGYALPAKEKDNFLATGLSNKIKHRDGDVRNAEQLQNYFNEVKPDIAFHLAAQSLVIESYTDPRYNFETNIMGTVNFFEAVKNCSSVKVAINITSDKCYQNNELERGYNENDAMGGHDPYSASKGCAELITTSYIKSFFNKENTVHVASARAGNVIGAGDWAENRLIPDLVKAYNSNQTAGIRNADSVRPWQFVLEPLYGYLKLGEKLLSHGKTFAGGWNFGPSSVESYSVGDVVEEVKKIIPALKITISKTAEQLHEARLLKLDITKAVNGLGWKPKLNFKQTIAMTLKGYLAEQDPNTDLYANRVMQIKEYCAKD